MCRDANLPDILPNVQDDEDIRVGIINNDVLQNADRFQIEGRRFREDIVRQYF